MSLLQNVTNDLTLWKGPRNVTNKSLRLLILQLLKRAATICFHEIRDFHSLVKRGAWLLKQTKRLAESG